MKYCVLLHCRRAKNKAKKRYFTFPSISTIIHTNRLNEERREKWLQALRLDSNFRWRAKHVCEDHFVSGRPAKNTDKNNVDWVPSLKLDPDPEIPDSSESDEEVPESTADLKSPISESQPTSQNITMELGDIILDGTDAERCEFCLKLPEEEQQIVVPPTEELTTRGTIEFVLGVSVEPASSHGASTATLHCCLTCWVTFESFYDFKVNCLASMKTRRKILSDLKPDVKPRPERPLIHSEEVFWCQRCYERCSSQKELDEHMTRYCFESEDEPVEKIEEQKPPLVEFVENPVDDNDEFLKEDRTQTRIFPKNFIFCCRRCNSLFDELGLLQDHKEKCNVPRRVEKPETGEKDEQGVLVFRCKLCTCSYNTERLLQFHMNKHYDTPEWVCRKGCNRTFYFPSNRSNHEKNCYGKNRVAPRLPVPMPKKRKRVDADGKPRKRNFVYPPGYVWCCAGCKAKFSGLGVLKKHKTSCEALYAKKVSPNDDVIKRIKPDSNGMFRCLLCPNSCYKTALLYSFHMNRHYDDRKFACRVREGCNRAFFNPTLRNLHEKDCQKETGYICTRCGDELKSRDTLRTHMRAHGKDNYECMICAKKFKTRNNYTSHWMRHYSGADPVASAEANIASVENLPRDIICELCQKGLPSHGIYARHRRYCNQPESPPPSVNRLQCKECPKSFPATSQQRFQEHQNKHLGIRSVACRMEGCTSKFFNVHTRNTHELNCGKQWVCSECGLVFGHRNSLYFHMETHSENPPTCEVCNKKFSSRKSLSVHAVTHTKEKNYACPICDRRFTQNSSVKTHLKTHSEEEKQGLDPDVHVFYAKDG